LAPAENFVTLCKKGISQPDRVYQSMKAYLGTLRDGMLGQFTREDETDSGLDLAGRDRRLLGVLSQTRGLLSDALKD
jgi:hypothetical protein